MTKTVEIEPWRGLSEQVAAVIEPELEAVAADTLAAIAREVPDYARPLEGSFGRGIRTGVGEALRQFVALIRDPDARLPAGRLPGRRPSRLAEDLGRRPPRAPGPRGAQPARRGDLRLHRRALC